MRASNLSEYVAKYAILYNRRRDEELQKLLQFQRANTCDECGCALSSCNDRVSFSILKCYVCYTAVHSACVTGLKLLYDEEEDNWFCKQCRVDVEERKCTKCNIGLNLENVFLCLQCNTFYCDDCPYTNDNGTSKCVNPKCV